MALGKVKWSNKPGPGKPSPLAIRTQGLTSKSERAPEGPQVPNASRKSAQALATVAPVTPALTGVGTSLGDAVAEASPPATAVVSDVPTDGAQPNGHEIDIRMAKIKEILAHAAMHLLEKCALAAEWLHHAEAKLSAVLGQHVEKSAGRPEGALTRAARELCVPGSTPTARRKFMERALKIDSIRPEAKSAAQSAGLDNIQSALLSIAAERSVEAQLAKVQEIAARKAMPRRKSTSRSRGEHTTVAAGNSQNEALSSVVQHAVDLPEVAETDEVWTADDEIQFGSLREAWTKDNVLKRGEWRNASERMRRRFARDFLFGTKLI